MKKFVIIGLGRFGYTVATTLFKDGADVLVIDSNENKIEEIKDLVTHTAVMDCTVERSLKKNNLADYDGIILSVGDIEVSVLTTVLLKKIGAGPIYVKAESEIHSRILNMIGVKEVLLPEEQVGKDLSKRILATDILDFLELGDKYRIVELVVPKKYVGKKVKDMELSPKNINLIGIKFLNYYVSEDGENQIEESMNMTPGANDELRQGEVLYLLGADKNIDLFLKDIQGRNYGS